VSNRNLSLAPTFSQRYRAQRYNTPSTKSEATRTFFINLFESFHLTLVAFHPHEQAR
jgi:hypothetical protein